MKRVLILIPSLSCGGAEKCAADLSQHLSKSCEVYVCIFGTEAGVDYKWGGTLLNLELGSQDSPLKKIVNLTKRIIRVRSIKKHYKIDTTFSFLEGANYINILSGLSRIVVSVREHKSNMDGAMWVRKLTKYLIRYLYPRSDRIVAVSHGVKTDLVSNFGICESSVEVIHNMVDLNLIERESKKKLPKEHMLAFRSPVIVTVGRLSRPKGQWHLLRVFSRLKKTFPTATLLILGDGEYRDRLVKYAGGLGLSVSSAWESAFQPEQDVFFLGYCANPYQYISRSNVFVLSSLWEGFPNSLVEAMGCGVPVISSDCDSGPREILSPDSELSRGMLVPVCDGKWHPADHPLTPEEQSLQETIQSILRNDKVASTYQEYSIRRSMEFNPEKILKKWELLI